MRKKKTKKKEERRHKRKDNSNERKKYYKSTETIRDRAKLNLAGHRVRRLSGNYFQPCHKNQGTRTTSLLPHRCIESLVCPLADIFYPHNAERAKDEFLSMLTLTFNEIEIKQSPISFRSAASARHNFIETSSID